jgi:hypothetical protein
MTFNPLRIVVDPIAKLKRTLDNHIFRTYRYLRVGMAMLAILLPILLWIVGGILGIRIQDTISHYYHASDVTRNLFVGILYALGVFLVLYVGFNKWEDSLLNLAGVCAVGVAMVPMVLKCESQCPAISWHGVFAVTAFVSIAIVCFLGAWNEKLGSKYKFLYWVYSALMILGPATAFVLTTVFHIRERIFLAEAIGLFSFAGYWLTKTFELWENEERLRLSVLSSRAVGASSVQPQGKP